MRGELTPKLQLLLRVLTRAANENRPAPSNHELTGALDLESPATASFAVKRLERLGHIVVTRFNIGRQITIVETGATTHYDGLRRPHWREERAAGVARRSNRPQPGAAANDVAGALPPRLDRDPCFRCGTRADLGCEHQAPSQPWEAPRG